MTEQKQEDKVENKVEDKKQEEEVKQEGPERSHFTPKYHAPDPNSEEGKDPNAA